MHYSKIIPIVTLLISSFASAQWKKINDVDYEWGPFKIYNIALFSETGKYTLTTRPLMLTLKYMKPVDGRDFAISLARSWSNLGITLPEQDKVVDRLRKIMPDIKVGDSLSYIALSDKGYFVLNDLIIDEEFNQDFNNAVVSVWLDPRVEIGKKLLHPTDHNNVQLVQNKTMINHSTDDYFKVVLEEKSYPFIEKNVESTIPMQLQTPSETNSKETDSKIMESPHNDPEIEISPPGDDLLEFNKHFEYQIVGI
ncbi:pyruvate formate lyase-activating protein [Otariodibacter sp.]|uniref:pyruvate formate lyase-activating protein n=1 Tax=Otariodibacter sp. TaxID=3030919 RepID=UPI00260430A2|nr:pyruvate formate lyase-activating protein [Otariodibacter sp.]